MIRINLLPIKELRAEVSRRRDLVIGSVTLGLVAVLLLGMYVFQTYQLTTLEKELAGLRAELQALNTKVKEVADLQLKIKDLRSKQKIIDDLNQKKTGPVLVMTSLSQATPTRLWLTDLRESAGSVTMNGVAVDHETIANFIRSLALSKHFTNVELLETTQGAGPTAAFKKFAIKAGISYRAPDAQLTDAKAKTNTVKVTEKKP
jgi:type IV pilus assembly protein PilN